MNILIKIEEMINRLLTKIFELFAAQFRKLIPKKLLTTTPKVVKPKIPLKEKAKNFIPLAKNSFQKVLEQISKVMSRLNVIVIKIKQIEKIKLTPSALLLTVVGLLAAPLIKLKTWALSLSTLTLSGIIITGSIGAVTAISVYHSTSKILNETGGQQVRTVEVPQTVRPKYHKLSDKQLVISNVQMPVYVESVAAMKTLLLEFTIQSSNRYIISYFLEQEHLVRDRLSLNLEPIVPELPLSQEGKNILKDKIRNELNTLLKDMGVKGKIESVHFESIIAG